MRQEAQRNDKEFAKDRARERAENSKWRNDMIEAISESKSLITWDEALNLQGYYSDDSKIKHYKDLILSQLWFESLPDRQDRIVKAYRGTCGWIFDDPKDGSKLWTNFADWLQNGQGLYWISGKAGSGKSTLLKYLWAHPRTHIYLQKWSGSLPLRVAEFFFWSCGDEIQRSEIGLLQCLLYRLLSQEPNIIPRLFPERWAS